ncbi:hypothetical protein LCM20_12490 [Halobacillus litoralis]|uniref:hypothetical protein n=1 Tax=Halobacillus litoralis TaxID=45668 RepID=UPI001CD1D605|nr:hypothetical protein [Halobacillus litoralis]MCA0971415.1 hypothetical protein [Halobacillus litoralis]
MKDRERIPFPNDREMKNQVSGIIEGGLEQQEGFLMSIHTLLKKVGFQHIFRDATEILFTLLISGLTLIGFVILTSTWVSWNDVNLYAAIFTTSPLLYGVFVYFFFIQKQTNPAFDVEMVCKYNVHVLAAVRMLAFSLLTIVLNGIALIALSVQTDIHLLFALLLSFISLFICSSMFLYIQHAPIRKLSPISVMVGWVVLNLALYSIAGAGYEAVILSIPIYVYLIIAVLTGYVYIKQVMKFLQKPKGVPLC